MMICVEQIKAARAWMGWTRELLAEEAGVSSGTIRNLEDGNISPRDDTTRAICDAFERKGLEFTLDGIRKRRKETRPTKPRPKTRREGQYPPRC